MRTVLTIAGSDCSGGAGIQADLKTMTALGLYGQSVITALTAQNTMGVADIMPVSPDFLEKQLQCVFTDIVPDAVKLGMITGIAQMRVIQKCLIKYQAKHVVMDPVMVSTSGRNLMEPDALAYYQEHLLPLAEIYTPNLPEAEQLLQRTVKTREERVAAAREFALQYKGTVYLKGGHDMAHGTGCTMSSALACGLALGLGVQASAEMAKAYITGAIAAGMDLGKGNGPLNHIYKMKET